MLQLNSSTGLQVAAMVLLSGDRVWASGLCATVMDFARLPLPSVSVSARNLTTGRSYSAVTEKTGTACLSAVPEGLYAVEASLPGFLHVRYYPVRVTPIGKQELSFWLPFGDITEGGLGEESTLSGTLLIGGLPVDSAEVCVVGSLGGARTCTVTNELGEYALLARAGVYRTEVRTRDGKVYISKVDISTPGIYRNRLTVDGSARKP